MIYILKKVTHYTIQFYDFFLTGTKRYDHHTIMIVFIASKISLIPISQFPSSVLTDLLSVYCFYFSRMSFKWNQTCINFLTWFTSLSIEHMRFIYVVSVCIYALFMSFLFYFAEYYFIVWIYYSLFTNWWTFGLFLVFNY